MNMHHDIDAGEADPVDDLSTLAWVHDELRRSLESAHKSLRRYLKEALARSGSDVDAVDPSVLRSARAQLHQGVGALEMVGLPGPARVLRVSENAVQRFIAKPRPISSAAVEAIESASFGVLDYLGRKLAGKGVPTLALFPQYRALQELVGADRVHPADLWRDEWQWRLMRADHAAVPHVADAGARNLMEAQVLAVMRSADRGAMAALSNLCAGLSLTSAGQLAGLWQLSAAFFEAQSAGLLQPDNYAKRVSSRLLAQLRMSVAGQHEVSQRLAQDVLFFCANARAPGGEHPAPRLQAVRDAYEIDSAAAFDYQSLRLGRFDPALIAQARKRVAGAKDVWSAVAGGELHRMAGLAEQFVLVGDSLERLYPSGKVLAEAMQAAVEQTLADSRAPGAELAMEVATSLLYLDASLEDGEFDQPPIAARVQRLAQRIRQVAEGRDAQPLEPWMEELYRRVSDRQTMGSVVQELRAALSEVEKQIDQYFRNPAQREVLIPVPGQLQAMRGVLSVLDMEQASQAVLRMSEDIDALASAGAAAPQAAQPAGFERLADNLGALSFMIDMLSVQPQMAKSLFAFDPASGNLAAVMGRRKQPLSAFGGFDELAAEAPLVRQAQTLVQAAAQPEVPDEALQQGLRRLSEQALLADQRTLAETMVSAQARLHSATDDSQREAVRVELAQAVADLAPVLPVEVAVQQPVRMTPEPEVHGATGLEEDTEMREIFIEEAREVLQSAGEAIERLHHAPEDLGDLTLMRRAFHTLKGSSRMVGLKDFGEAAWACEQLYNARLAEHSALDTALGAFTVDALRDLGRWVDAIAESRPSGQHAAEYVRRAEALREPAAPEPSAALLHRVPELPSAQDLSFDLDLGDSPAPAAAPPPAEPGADFVLDLDLDGDGEAPAAAAPAAGSVPAMPAPPVADEALHLLLDLGTEPGDGMASIRLDSDVAWHTPSEAGELSVDDFGDADFEAAFGKAGGATAAQADASADVELPAEAGAPQAGDEQVKLIGDLRIGIPLFNIYLNEADELSRRLCTELAEWAMVPDRPPPESSAALAHSLAGSSATVGFVDLSVLARSLEHAVTRSIAVGQASPEEPQLFNDAADEIRHLLHQFAAGFLKHVSAPLMKRLQRHELELAAASAAPPQQPATAAAPDAPVSLLALPPEAAADAEPPPAETAIDATVPADAAAQPEASPATTLAASGAASGAASQTAAAPAPPSAAPQLPGLGEPSVSTAAQLPQPLAAAARSRADALDDEDDIDAQDRVDEELFPIFREEGEELLPQLQARMRDWARRPAELPAAAACMRTLHTFKGGARLAGAMRLGEMAHRLETAIEHLVARGQAGTADVEALLGRVDEISTRFDMLGRPAAEAAPAAAVVDVPVPMPLQSIEPLPRAAAAPAPAAPAPTRKPPPPGQIDWGRFDTGAAARPAPAAEAFGASMAAVRVRAPLLDRLVNHAGEVSITRSRIESDVGQIKGSLGDLTENLERLRRQLRDLELQAESQISSRMEAAKAASQEFDPLEMDRFTRFQELTRMMAESVNDVATVQRGLQRSLQATEDELASQARLTRNLQDDLLRTRMVEFESLADRLYRVVRQAAKDCAKQVRLDIAGGSIEVDRGVLERMIGPFEHLLRNAVAHGIELPEARVRAGKDASGRITIAVAQEGNEVAVEFRDDGAGLDLARIRERALERKLIAEGAEPADAELANLIFAPGFSTVEGVTELAGRGVGMDVVRSEVNAMGGRIETATAAGAGSSFRLVLPLTTAVTQVVMLRCGDSSIAVPSTLVEIVKRVPRDEIEQAYAQGSFASGERVMSFFWLGALLQAGGQRSTSAGRAQPVVVIRSASQRVALHVDEVLGNQEVVVKNLGPQLSRLPGLAGITLLPSGAVALIYNPVALATLYGEAAREPVRVLSGIDASADAESGEVRAPLVLVVDDSLTVRRVTQRLLSREGYRVTLAKDGLDALDKLGEELPAVVLSDIEMPRMDGFDLVRNMRSDSRLANLPVIMITSRIAQKHRDYAAELGVNHYLGKPYSEEELLALVGHYVVDAAVH